MRSGVEQQVYGDSRNLGNRKDGRDTAMEPNAGQPELKLGSKPNARDDLKSLPLPEVEKNLGSSPDGLSQAEAQKRLTQYGPNEIEEKETNPFLKFLTYFWGPIPWMIDVAVILSAVARHWPDFVIILLLLLANAVVGFWEEHQAGNAIAALKAKLAIKARVKRDGKWINPAARELVPGDVIRLRLGDIVPADARLLEGDPVEVDQSALTGESLPATRRLGEAVFSGSIIRQGEIGALVYATGANTYFGKTAQLVQEAHTVSHFQRAVLKIGNYLIILAAVLVTTIIAVAIFRGDPILTTLQFALVLTVAAIPVAMPTVLSVTMAAGARLLAKKGAIVTRLSAIEELAGVDILCSDKTGTLTQNKLTLGDPFSVNGIPADQVILNAALASRAEDKDAVDLAVLGGLKNGQALKGYQVIHFQPFDPVHKRTEATVKDADGREFKVAKGAPQVILELSANAAQVKPAAEKAVNDFAARGFRSLGVARAEGEGEWQFLGVLPLFDPPRDDAKATFATARQMGVSVKMVTGDALAIARETATKLGMGTNILDASGFGDTKRHETAALAEVDREGRWLRPGIPRTQIPHCGCPAARRPHRRHDGRRGERRPGAEESRLRYRCFGSDGDQDEKAHCLGCFRSPARNAGSGTGGGSAGQHRRRRELLRRHRQADRRSGREGDQHPQQSRPGPASVRGESFGRPGCLGCAHRHLQRY